MNGAASTYTVWNSTTLNKVSFTAFFRKASQIKCRNQVCSLVFDMKKIILLIKITSERSLQIKTVPRIYNTLMTHMIWFSNIAYLQHILTFKLFSSLKTKYHLNTTKQQKQLCLNKSYYTVDVFEVYVVIYLKSMRVCTVWCRMVKIVLLSRQQCSQFTATRQFFFCISFL